MWLLSRLVAGSATVNGFGKQQPYPPLFPKPAIMFGIVDTHATSAAVADYESLDPWVQKS
jgi:hypothetical protein